MNWTDWEIVWRRQELPRGEAAEVEEIKRTFEAKRQRLARSVTLRNVSETVAAMIVAAALVLIWWQVGADGWPFGIALAIVAGVAGVFVCDQRRSRRNRVAPDAILRAKVEAEIAELQRQRRLMTRVAVWYLSPVALVVAITLATLYVHQKPWERSPLFVAVFSLVYVSLNIWAWRVNRREVRRRIDPRLAELQKLRQQLTGQPPDDETPSALQPNPQPTRPTKATLPD